MTTPNSTPKQNSPTSPDPEELQGDEAGENTSSRTGFFHRVRRELNPEPIHPFEAAEIVVDPETLE